MNTSGAVNLAGIITGDIITIANIIIGFRNIRVVTRGRSAVGEILINSKKDYFDRTTIKGRK
jgi:hypothetical protein